MTDVPHTPRSCGWLIGVRCRCGGPAPGLVRAGRATGPVSHARARRTPPWWFVASRYRREWAGSPPAAGWGQPVIHWFP